MSLVRHPYSPYALLLFVALLVVWAYGIMEIPIYGDRGYFIYLSQLVARGGSLYQDSPYGYTPLGPLLSGGLIYLLEDVSGLKSYLIPRLGGFVAFLASSMLLYKTALVLFRRKLVALLCGLSWLGLSYVAVVSSGGLEPKVLVALLAILALYAVFTERYFLSGLACGLAVCCWQVAILYPLGIFLWLLLRRQITWKALGTFLAGGALSFIALLAYLYFSDSFTAFWQQAFLRKLAIEGDTLGESPFHWLTKLWPGFAGDMVFFLAAFLGFARCSVGIVNGFRRKAEEPGDPRFWLLLILTLLWSGFNTIEFQGSMDFVPMLPVLALWLAYFAARVMSGTLPSYAVAATLVLFLFADLLFIPESITLQDQEALVARINAQYQPDRVLVSGADFWYVIDEQPAPLKYFRMQYFEEYLMEHFAPGSKIGLLNHLRDWQPDLIITPVNRKNISFVKEADIFVQFRTTEARGPAEPFDMEAHRHFSLVPAGQQQFEIIQTQWSH